MGKLLTQITYLLTFASFYCTGKANGQNFPPYNAWPQVPGGQNPTWPGQFPQNSYSPWNPIYTPPVYQGGYVPPFPTEFATNPPNVVSRNPARGKTLSPPRTKTPKIPITTTTTKTPAVQTSETECIGAWCITVHLKPSTWQQAHDACKAEGKSMARLMSRKTINAALELVHKLNRNNKYDNAYLWVPIQCSSSGSNALGQPTGACTYAEPPLDDFPTDSPAKDEQRVWQLGEPDFGAQTENAEPCVALLYGSALQKNGRIADSNGRLLDYECAPALLEGKGPSFVFAYACESGGTPPEHLTEQPKTEPTAVTTPSSTTSAVEIVTSQTFDAGQTPTPTNFGRAWEDGKIFYVLDKSLSPYERSVWSTARRNFLDPFYEQKKRNDDAPPEKKCVSLVEKKLTAPSTNNYVVVGKPKSGASSAGSVCNSVSLGMEGGVQRFELSTAQGRACNLLSGLLRLAGVDIEQQSLTQNTLSEAQVNAVKKLYKCY